MKRFLCLFSAVSGASVGRLDLSSSPTEALVGPTGAFLAPRLSDRNYRNVNELTRMTVLPEICPADQRSHRVGYIYTDRVLVSLDWRLRRFVLEKIARDIENDAMTPRLNFDGEFDASGRRLVKVGDAIANRPESIVLKVREVSEDMYGTTSGGILIKYQSNCGYLQNGISAIHPLVIEEFFSHQVMAAASKNNPLGRQISPRIFAVSPPVFLPLKQTLKTDFRMSEYMRERCVAGKSMVRFMIVEKGGQSLEDVALGGPIPFVEGMKIMKQVFEILNIVQIAGIVHGDIHRGNIVQTGNDATSYWLIDYGFAKFFNGKDRMTKEVTVNPVLTHWSLMGHSSSFRDDAMQAMMTIASVIGGREYIEKLRKSSREALFYFYGYENIFVYLGKGDESMMQSEKHHALVLKMLKYVRSLNHSDQVNYDTLIKDVEDIINFVA